MAKVRSIGVAHPVVTVNEEYGTDYAVRGGNVEVVSFQFSTAIKRIKCGNSMPR